MRSDRSRAKRKKIHSDKSFDVFVVMKALMCKVALASVRTFYTLTSSVSTWVTTVPEGVRISVSTTLRSRRIFLAHSILRSVVLLCIWYLHSITAYNPGTSWRNEHAFAALLGDGSVTAWGDSSRGGSGVPSGLSNVQAIYSTRGAFAALMQDGSVAAWGSSKNGGSGVPSGLSNVCLLYTSPSPRDYAASRMPSSA